MRHTITLRQSRAFTAKEQIYYYYGIKDLDIVIMETSVVDRSLSLVIRLGVKNKASNKWSQTCMVAI